MHTNTNCHYRKKHLLEHASTNKLLGIMIVLKHRFVFVLIHDHFTVFHLLYLIRFAWYKKQGGSLQKQMNTRMNIFSIPKQVFISKSAFCS